MAKYYFCGIAGSGMSALSQITAMEGHKVSGSDRSFDRGENKQIKKKLERLGVKIYPQDGSGIKKDIDFFIYSTAVEKSNIEIVKAKEMNLKIMHRSELLSKYISSKKTIAVGGTSGKTTLTAMIWHILSECGYEPSLINGGFLISLMEKGFIGNAFYGKGNYLVIEADESDSTIENYHPYISIIHNIKRDHKEINELKKIFTRFAQNSWKVFLNEDDENSLSLKEYIKNCFTYGIKKCGVEIKKSELFYSEFKAFDYDFKLSLGGIHNITNAIAAISVCREMGLEIKKISKAIENFKGSFRRFNLIGEIEGISVIDDYAHNPHKISSTLKHCLSNSNGRRVIFIHQPHGFAPTRMFKDELIEIFSSMLRDKDILIMNEIYYAGGSVKKDISSKDVVDEVKKKKNAFFFAERKDLLRFIERNVKEKDIILLTGARDPTLHTLAQEIFKTIAKKYAKI
ncbi:MAG: UDP-N-acetylmuramate--L-alanine ligase [Elusimicrobiales bacterium]